MFAILDTSWFSLPMVFAAYVACGVLTFAIRYYSRPGTYYAPRAPGSVRRPERRVPPAALDTNFGWTHHTVSS